MDKKHRNKLMFRWSLGTAAAIALFWAIYWYITKEVPVITEIKIPFIFAWELPFPISRWWDILLGPVYMLIIIQIMESFAIKVKGLLVIMGNGLLLLLIVSAGWFYCLGWIIVVYSTGASLLAFLGIIEKPEPNFFNLTFLIITTISFVTISFVLVGVFNITSEGGVGVGAFLLSSLSGLLLDLWLVSGIVYGLIGGVIGGLVIELFLGIRAIVQLIISFITDKKFKKILQQQELARQLQEQEEETAYQEWLRRNRKQAQEQEITPQQLTPGEEEDYQKWLARNRGLFQH